MNLALLEVAIKDKRLTKKNHKKTAYQTI